MSHVDFWTYERPYIQAGTGAICGIDEAGRFAAAISTLKIEAMGPFSGTKADIEQCIQTAEQTMPRGLRK